MKILLEIPDSKATSLMDVLKSISYVKATKLTDAKARLMSEIREATEEINFSGQEKRRPVTLTIF